MDRWRLNSFYIDNLFLYTLSSHRFHFAKNTKAYVIYVLLVQNNQCRAKDKKAFLRAKKSPLSSPLLVLYQIKLRKNVTNKKRTIIILVRENARRSGFFSREFNLQKDFLRHTKAARIRVRVLVTRKPFLTLNFKVSYGRCFLEDMM